MINPFAGEFGRHWKPDELFVLPEHLSEGGDDDALDMNVWAYRHHPAHQQPGFTVVVQQFPPVCADQAEPVYWTVRDTSAVLREFLPGAGPVHFHAERVPFAWLGDQLRDAVWAAAAVGFARPDGVEVTFDRRQGRWVAL